MDLNNEIYPLSAAALRELLLEHQIQPTLQRIEIARQLFGKDDHWTAEQVLNQVIGAGAVVSKATVYNTLGLFAKRHLLRPVTVGGSRLFYDTNTTAHHHFYNLDTGQLTDVAAEDIDIALRPCVPEGSVVAGIEVMIRIVNSD